MRKLTHTEEHVLAVLRSHRSYCPGQSNGNLDIADLIKTLDALVKKKYATVEETQDGPRYHARG